MKPKLITLITLLTITFNALGQTIKDYYIPDSSFNKALYYVADEYGNRTDFTRTIYYVKGKFTYNITDARFYQDNPVSIETNTVRFDYGSVQLIKSSTTNVLETNKKRQFNPAKIILKMPLPGQSVTWVLIQPSGQKETKTAGFFTIDYNGELKKAIKVKTSVFGYAQTYTNEYYVEGIGLWKSETVSYGVTTTQYQFDELSFETP